jgi:hypothetical protein
VCPYLIDLNEIDPRHPLSQFQSKPTTKEGTYDVVRSMHQALLACNKDADLTYDELKEAFEDLWPKLAEKLRDIPSAPSAIKEEEPPDTLKELLVLTKDIARSVSALQAHALSRPVATSSLYGSDIPLMPNVFPGALSSFTTRRAAGLMRMPPF